LDSKFKSRTCHLLYVHTWNSCSRIILVLEPSHWAHTFSPMTNYDLTFQSLKSMVWIFTMIISNSFLLMPNKIIRSWKLLSGSVLHSSKKNTGNMCHGVMSKTWFVHLYSTKCLLYLDILAIAPRAGILSTSCFVSHKIVWNLIPDVYIWPWQSTTKREVEEQLTEVHSSFNL